MNIALALLHEQIAAKMTFRLNQLKKLTMWQLPCTVHVFHKNYLNLIIHFSVRKKSLQGKFHPIYKKTLRSLYWALNVVILKRGKKNKTLIIMHIHECVHIYSIARQIRVSNGILQFSILMEKYFLFNSADEFQK